MVLTVVSVPISPKPVCREQSANALAAAKSSVVGMIKAVKVFLSSGKHKAVAGS
jgi:uncharacterized protein (UPF0212 family)